MQHARLLSIAIAVLALAHTADAKPKPKGAATKAQPKKSAKAHVDAATKAHKEGKFDVALTELKAAYEIDPQPKLLFAIAQVYSKLDDCGNAVENYEKFLATEKDKKKQAVVKQAIAACKDKTPAVAATTTPADDKSDVFRKSKPEEAPPPPAVETTPPPPPIETQPTPPPVETPPPPPPVVSEPLPPGPTATVTVKKPFYKDLLGDVLVVGGVAAGVVSFLQYRGAVAKLDDAEHAATLADYDANVSDAHSQRNVSLILAGGGVVLVGAGLLRYKMHDRTETHQVAIVPTKDGGFVTWTGGF
jgi:hypothetical protein